MGQILNQKTKEIILNPKGTKILKWKLRKWLNWPKIKDLEDNDWNIYRRG